MKLQYIASACVLIEHQGVKVLCDPWLTNGIYGGAWYHNPPLTVTPEDFADISAIYLSHIHPDHADFATLARLPRVPVFMASYVEAFLAAKVRALGFPVEELKTGVTYAWANGLKLSIIAADNCDPQLCGRWIGCQIREPKWGQTQQIDSMALFEAEGQSILNVNDCPYELSRAALDRVRDYLPRPIDLLCVGYAGAGPWPQCFRGVDRRVEAEKKRAQFIRQMQQFVSHLQPKRYLPFAGQYTLGGSLVDLNDYRGVPELEDLPDDLRMVRLNRNAWFDCETGQASEPFTPVPVEERLAYRETLRGNTLDHESDPWPNKDQWGQLVERSYVAWRDRLKNRGISVPDDIIVEAVFEDGTVDGLILSTGVREPPHREVTIRADARLWMRVLTRAFNANNAEVGSLFTISRNVPYSRATFHSLSYLHA